MQVSTGTSRSAGLRRHRGCIWRNIWGIPLGNLWLKTNGKKMMLHQRRKWRNNLEGKHSTYMEQSSSICPWDFENKVLFSNSDGWYLLISARYKYLTSVYSSSVENRRRNRLKNVHSQGKTGSCLICLAAGQRWKSFWVTKENIHGEKSFRVRKALCCVARRAARWRSVTWKLFITIKRY